MAVATRRSFAAYVATLRLLPPRVFLSLRVCGCVILSLCVTVRWCVFFVANLIINRSQKKKLRIGRPSAFLTVLLRKMPEICASPQRTASAIIAGRRSGLVCAFGLFA